MIPALLSQHITAVAARLLLVALNADVTDEASITDFAPCAQCLRYPGTLSDLSKAANSINLALRLAFKARRLPT